MTAAPFERATRGRDRSVGFIGLGTMGEPMAQNLVRSGANVLAWNRTPAKSRRIAAAGGMVATSLDDVFEHCEKIFLMLADAPAIDAVLDRNGSAFERRVSKHTIIHMGTTSPAHSQHLETDVNAAGGLYVEAPVSGSRTPAEDAQLVAMVAGDVHAVGAVTPLLACMCRSVIPCGAVPNALTMKLAVNSFLITMVTGLTEALHFAERHALDIQQFVAVLNAGPMASEVSRAKLAKLADRDFAVQASIANVRESTRLIAEAANAAGVGAPLLETCRTLYNDAVALGLGDSDMVAVLRAIEMRDDVVTTPSEDARLRRWWKREPRATDADSS